MVRKRLTDTRILGMAFPVAVTAFLSAVLIIVAVLKALISLFMIPGVIGMEPKAQLLDEAVVDRHAYSWGNAPKRGDIVAVEIFRDFPMIFRVFGLPGDLVRNIDGRLELNGTLITRTCRAISLPPEFPSPQERAVGLTENMAADLLCEENWPGMKQSIKTLDGFSSQQGRSSRQKLIRADHYLLISDNRTATTDSFLIARDEAKDPTRDETVSRREIIGRVVFFVPYTKQVFCPERTRTNPDALIHPSCWLIRVLEKSDAAKSREAP